MNLKWSKRINLRDYRTASNIVALDFEGEPGQTGMRFYFAIAVVEEIVMYGSRNGFDLLLTIL